MAGSMGYRLPVEAPDSPAIGKLATAMQALQGRLDNKSYNFIAGFHGAPSWYCWHHQVNPRTSVQARLFLPWHRAYLWWLEQALQDHVADAALPWWDWTTTRQVPNAYSVSSIGGKRNPLKSYRMRIPATVRNPAINHTTRRAPGKTLGVSLPTAQEIGDVLDDSDWPSFSDRLESYHDDVHGWVGGDMRDVTTAAFDPIFFAHHCMIDRIWYLWQVRWGVNRIQGELLDLPLQPFGKTVRQTLDVQALGYEYAASSAAFNVQG